MSTYVDPEEDEIFTRKTLEIAILIFSRKGNKKKNTLKKEKGGSNRSHWAKFPVAAVSGSHGKGCHVYDGTRAHTDRWPIPRE